MHTIKLSLTKAQSEIFFRNDDPNCPGVPKITLIKAIREITGLGLNKSKDVVDELCAKGSATISLDTVEGVSTKPLEVFNSFLRVEQTATLREEVDQALTTFARRAVDEKKFNLARILIETLEKL